MPLKQAIYTNWCQHARRELEFHPGLNALVGPNGSGKSNLIGGLIYALTGEVPGPGTKAAHICLEARERDPAGVELTLEYDAQVLILKRQLRPSGQLLQLGAESWTSCKEIQEQLENVLGVPGAVYDEYVFVRQWQIFSFLEQRDAERARTFQRLLGLDHLEHLWKLLGEFSLPWPKLLYDEDVVCTRHKITQNELVEVHRQLEDLEDLPVDLDPAGLPESQQLEQILQVQRLQERCHQLYQQIQQASTCLEKWSPAEFDTAYWQEKAQEAQAGLSVWQRYRPLLTRQQQLRQQLQQLEVQEKKDPFEEIWHSLPLPLAELRAQQGRREVAQGTLERWLGAVTADHCPTCGSPVEHLREQIPEVERRLNVLKRQSQVLQEHIRRSEAQQAWQARQAQRDRQRTWLVQQQQAWEQEAGDVEAPAHSEVQYRAQLEEARKQLVVGAEQSRQKDLLQGRLELLRESLNQLDQERQQRHAQNPSLSYDAETVQALRQRQQQTLARHRQKLHLLARQEVLTTSLQADHQLLEEIHCQQRQTAQLECLQTRLTQLRQLFHHQAVPREVTEYYLQRLLNEMNNLLDTFESPFRVQLGDSLVFLARLASGHLLPANRLSGGEKVLLALAFRIALNAVFARDLGLLVLDEPAAGLDEDNLLCLQKAFDRLRELSSSSGLQVVLVTHEPTLAHLCDRVHQLGRE